MKILIIDDDSGLRKSLSLILTDAGYEVVQAEDGEIGLATARAQRPDIILCDVRMPSSAVSSSWRRTGRRAATRSFWS